MVASLLQAAQKIVHLFGDRTQTELELLLVLHHARSLVAQMLQGGGQVDLLHALRQTVQYQVDETVGARTIAAVRTVHDDRR